MQQAENKANNNEYMDEKLPLTAHLEELRSRLIKIFICLIVVFSLCYWKSEIIFNFISEPLVRYLPKDSTLAIIKLTEGFITELKMSFFAAIFFSMPFILYQIWKFIVPGLYTHEKKYAASFVISASILFFIGAAFAYYIVFPFGFKFFLKYATGDITATLSIGFYLTFFMQLILAFGIIFELPIFILFLSKLGIVNTDMLRKNRRYAILLIFIAAAILTPPDVISQCMMAAPLIILYEISIFVAKIFSKKKE
ncbi:MAG: twin-arginine translocase subunit TatC [Deferribacterota bacterium]|nr:twin-arginine translocase subunit TatC [Deferribacterota bacterium]